MNQPVQIDIEDRRLVAEYLSRRSESAFRRLYQRHTTALYGVVLRLLSGNVADAEEVVQEAWLVATQSMKSFKWQSSLRTWLTGTAINCARNRYRRRATEDARTAPASTDIAEIPSTELEALIDHDCADSPRRLIPQAKNLPPKDAWKD